MSMSEPREFDLHFFYGAAKVQLSSDQAFIKNEETIPVIEKSAYDSQVSTTQNLTKSLERLERALAYAKGMLGKGLDDLDKADALAEIGRLERGEE